MRKPSLSNDYFTSLHMAHKTKKKTLNQMFSKTAANYDFMDFSFIPIRKERRIHSYNWEGRKKKKYVQSERERKKL